MNPLNAGLRLKLDAFIISVSSYEDIKNIFGEGNYAVEDFHKHNIIFQERKEYISKIFNNFSSMK